MVMSKGELCLRASRLRNRLASVYPERRFAVTLGGEPHELTAQEVQTHLEEVWLVDSCDSSDPDPVEDPQAVELVTQLERQMRRPAVGGILFASGAVVGLVTMWWWRRA